MQTRAIATRERLILAAERLIGDAGLDGVSLRQISEASGSRNIAAAQYHFGSMRNLVLAVMAFRKATLDHLRERFYREMDMDFSHMSANEFVSLIIRPHLGLTDHDGRRTFARFLKAIQQDFDYYNMWQAHYREAPFANAIHEGLRNALLPMSDEIWHLRSMAMGKLIIGLIVDYDAQPAATRLSKEAFVAELGIMVTAALSAAPVPAAPLERPDRVPSSRAVRT